MKTIILHLVKYHFRHLFILGISFLFLACNNNSTDKKLKTTEVKDIKTPDIIWQIKAILPDGKKMNVKAFDNEGNMFDINAIQNSDQDSFLDIKAFVNGKKLPVKVLVSNKMYAPVKVIDMGGVAYDIKAITEDGKKLKVKGINRQGNIINLRVINEKGDFYNLKAISPDGKLNDVKGIKINVKEKEMTLNGFSILAHVKAMHESNDEDGIAEFLAQKKKEKFNKKKRKNKDKNKNEFKPIYWNVNAITPNDDKLEVKAFDEKGNEYYIKAIQDSKQHSFMNLKAFVDGSELPVKVLVSNETYSPIKALARDGATYNIKAKTKDGKLLDIKGVKRSGNIIHIKAINENGDFYGVKAISPDGQLDDVKGIKIFDRTKELTISGNKVYAHIKAITH